MKYRRIDLYNRYKEETYLEHKEGNKYLFVSQSPYVRCGLIKERPYHYTFIDVSGGPFLAVGSTIPALYPDGVVENLVIASIYYKDGYIIELEDDISGNRTKATVRKQGIQSNRRRRVSKTSRASIYCGA